MANTRMHGVFGTLLREKSSSEPRQSSSSISVEDEMDFSPSSTKEPAFSKGNIAVDIFEEEGYFIIKVPIAGVKLSDLDIDVTDNEVVIRGSRDQVDQVPTGKYLLQECYWGEFERRISLPFSVNHAKIKATFSKDSILKIFIPKEGGRKVKIVKISDGV